MASSTPTSSIAGQVVANRAPVLPSPTVGVLVTPTVSISINPQWIPVLLAAISLYETPDAWIVGTDYDFIEANLITLASLFVDA